MFEISEANLNGIHIEAKKNILIVDHGFLPDGAERCELLAKLYKMKLSTTTRIKLTYDKNRPPLCDQIGKEEIPEVIVPFPEAGRINASTAKCYPYSYGIIISYCVCMAVKYHFEVVAFPDSRMHPSFQEHSAYAAYTGTDKVKFHVPFIGRPEDIVTVINSQITLANAETVVIPTKAANQSR